MPCGEGSEWHEELLNSTDNFIGHWSRSIFMGISKSSKMLVCRVLEARDTLMVGQITATKPFTSSSVAHQGILSNDHRARHPGRVTRPQC